MTEEDVRKLIEAAVANLREEGPQGDEISQSKPKSSGEGDRHRTPRWQVQIDATYREALMQLAAAEGRTLKGEIDRAIASHIMRGGKI